MGSIFLLSTPCISKLSLLDSHASELSSHAVLESNACVADEKIDVESGWACWFLWHLPAIFGDVDVDVDVDTIRGYSVSR